MTAQGRTNGDITRTMVSVLFIGILITASIWILRPFLTSIVWATIIVIATWPILLKLQEWLWGRRGLAVAVVTVILLLVVVVPLTVAIAMPGYPGSFSRSLTPSFASSLP